MEEDKDEAILISSTPYLKGKRILKAFTKTKGLISLISPSKLSRPLSSPFSQMEIVYQKKHSDLFSLVEVKIVNYFLPLRQSYDHLQAGATLLKLIIDSQLPGKPASKIYALLLSYLSRISTFSSPDILTASFALKILSHDGLLRLLPHMIPTEAMALLSGRQAYYTSFLEKVLTDAKKKTALMKKAEESLRRRQLIFSRWVLVMTYFEQKLYQNPDADLNEIWWSLVEKYQGIPRPKNRQKKNDWAAKYHIGLAPVYYYSYLLAWDFI